MRKPTVEIPFYSSEKLYLAHEIGFWCGRLTAYLEDSKSDAVIEQAARAAFHYAALWLDLVEKEV